MTGEDCVVCGFMRMFVGTSDILLVVVVVSALVIAIAELAGADVTTTGLDGVEGTGEEGGDCLMSSRGGALSAGSFGAPFSAELLASCK